MAALIGLFVGAFVGNLLWHDWGAALGGVAGFLAGVKLLARRAPAASAPPTTGAGIVGPAAGAPAAGRTDRASVTDRGLIDRIDALERRVSNLEHAITGAGAVDTASPVPPAQVSQPPVVPATGIAAPVDSGTGEPHARPSTAAAETTITVPVSGRPNPLWRWFAGGNALTRIGVVVLFFGVAFLLRYFAEHFTVPIEWRLAGVAAGGFALVALGLRLAVARPGYGLSLQAAGAGVLYLTTYAAFQLYGVLPEASSIALLVAVSVLTVWLAVRSDSQPLAGLAVAGGFVAPMLIATGSDPALLFGYFAVLNGAIFVIAWRKAWRALNAVGFVSTFVLGAVWGHGFYRPEHSAVVQPYLILFFAFYVAIAILYARRGPLAAKDPVDGLLVFGVPLAAFALQVGLVRDERYGAAWSALALAAVYALLWLGLRKRNEPGFPVLSRAFVALAVIFATIAVPFAFDNRETAALWAVEAAGVYWIGVRQQARIVRAFALAVEIASGIVFAAAGVGGGDDRLFANAFFAGAMLIAVSGFVTARVADRAGDALTPAERSVVPLVFGWGVIWWLAAGSVEFVRHLPREEETHAILAWVTAGVALALVLRRWLPWPRLAGAGIALLPTMGVAALGDFDLARTTLTGYGWIVWPCAWLAHWQAMRAADEIRSDASPGKQPTPDAPGFLGAVHAFSAIALTVQLAWEASEWTGRWTPPYTVWTPCAAALPPIVFLWLITRFRGSTRWPAVPHAHAYAIGAGAPIAVLLSLWFFAVNVLSPGDPSPLPYLPLVSPLDLTLAVSLWALAAWAARSTPISERARYRWIGAGLFVALNGIVLRTAHQWADIPWRLGSMLASKPLQAALTLAWSATALSVMYIAAKRRLRPLWMLGAALLAVVVGKLFLVDLGALSGLPRVVAFLGAGILLLVIGYLSPLPPAAKEEAPQVEGGGGS